MESGQNNRRKSSVRFGATTILEVTEITWSILQRTPRAHRVAVGAGLFAAVCICLWFLLLVHSNSRVIWTPCSEPECEKAKQDLQSVLTPYVDPCHDFYGHVCSKRWLYTANIRDGKDFLDSAVTDYLGTVSSRLSGVNSESDQTLQVFATFNKICAGFVNSDAVTTLGEIARPLEKDVDILKLTNFSVLLGRIVNLTFARGIDTIFRLRLVKEPISGKPYLYLMHGGTLAQKLGERNHTETLKTYLQRALDEIFPADTTARDSLKHILELDDLVSYQLASAQPPVEYTVSRLQNLTSGLDAAGWLKLVNAFMVGSEKLTENTKLLSGDMDALEKVVGIFENITAYGLLYIYVHMVVDVLRFDYQGRFSASSSLGTKAKACFRASQDVVTRRWASLFISMTEWSAQEFRVMSTFSLIHPTVAHPYRFSWLDPSSKWKVMGAIGRLFVFPLLSIVRAQSDLESRRNSTELPNTSSNFPALFLQLKADERLALIRDPPSVDELVVNQLLLEGKIAYSSRLSAIMVPTAMSREPVSYPEVVPLEYNMGTLGALLIQELSRVILPRRGQDGTTETSSYRLTKSLQDMLRCVDGTARLVLNVSLAGTVGTVSEELFLWMRSARIAYDTLKERLHRYKSAKNWAPVWSEAQRTFFRRFCLLSCSAGQSPDPLPAEVRCVLPLVNMAEFSQAFECPADSRMNTERRCIEV